MDILRPLARLSYHVLYLRRKRLKLLRWKELIPYILFSYYYCKLLRTKKEDATIASMLLRTRKEPIFGHLVRLLERNSMSILYQNFTCQEETELISLIFLFYFAVVVVWDRVSCLAQAGLEFATPLPQPPENSGITLPHLAHWYSLKCYFL
jgi:hypothetical protein